MFPRNMLILMRDTRKNTIRSGVDIEIGVCQVTGNQVRIAIAAPKHVKVVRGELLKSD